VSFELTILGSSSALPTSQRFPTAHLLKVDERFFLIDCGEGTQVQMRRFGYNPGRIHHIFISHLHGDHVFGLFGLLSTLGMMGRKVPLNLYGPESLKPMMKQHFAFFGPLPFELLFHSPERGLLRFSLIQALRGSESGPGIKDPNDGFPLSFRIPRTRPEAWGRSAFLRTGRKILRSACRAPRWTTGGGKGRRGYP